MSDFQLGDHLYIYCGAYSHHGIYAGDGVVVHFDSTPGRKFLGQVSGKPPKISEDSIDAFSGGREIHLRNYSSTDDLFPPEEIVLRAKSRLGECGYDLAQNNCEHFAVWCKTGLASSSQVDSARKVAGAGAAGVAMGSAIVRSAKLLPGPYKVLAYGAGAAVALGSTTYQFIVEKNRNRKAKTS